ncbi:hypothetical protein [Sphingobacterium siyangense]|uniref:hypothetical protein n=1 Tax=Sphingobacterium siyangense TaxID=459529 RepID=UPI0028A22BF1|nr:hypothetical protein [Sphingobacterium siyangense]
MNRYLIFLSFFLIAAITKGQEGFVHVFVRGGLGYPSASQLALGLDFSLKDNNAYELSANYYRSKSRNENILLGINYKPIIIRSKNLNLRFRFGGYLGSDLKTFIVSPNAGIEWIQSLSSNVDLTFANNNGYFFGIDKGQRWRTSAEIGIRLPF